jgi:predicted dehydrogenase
VTVEDGQLVRTALRGTADTVPPPSAAQGAAADPAALDAAIHAAQLADLLAAADEGREPAVSGQDGRDALEVVRAVYESSRTSRPVRLAP